MRKRDEHIFSMVAQNTNPLRRSIHVDSVMSAKMMLEVPFGIMDSFIITKTAPNLAQMMMTNKTCSMFLFFSMSNLESSSQTFQYIKPFNLISMINGCPKKTYS